MSILVEFVRHLHHQLLVRQVAHPAHLRAQPTLHILVCRSDLCRSVGLLFPPIGNRETNSQANSSEERKQFDNTAHVHGGSLASDFESLRFLAHVSKALAQDVGG